MNKIIFILKNGVERECEFKNGETVLEVAEQNGIKINSGCEGHGICGLCHVFVENFFEKLCEISEQENDTLDRVSGVSENSRLACQIILNDSLNGIKVKLT